MAADRDDAARSGRVVRGRGRRVRAGAARVSRRRGPLARRRRRRATSSTSAPGTGKLTRSLVALGHRVTAVEPLAEMLAQLRAAVPGAVAVIGSAESIPLPDGSADVVTCAQAFHWFDHAARAPRDRPGAAARRPARAGLEHPRRHARSGSRSSPTRSSAGARFARAVSPLRPRASTRAASTGRSSAPTFAHVQTLGRSELAASSSAPGATAQCSRRRSAARCSSTSTPCSTRMPRTACCAMPYVTECFRAPGSRRRLCQPDTQTP